MSLIDAKLKIFSNNLESKLEQDLLKTFILSSTNLTKKTGSPLFSKESFAQFLSELTESYGNSYEDTQLDISNPNNQKGGSKYHPNNAIYVGDLLNYCIELKHDFAKDRSTAPTLQFALNYSCSDRQPNIVLARQVDSEIEKSAVLTRNIQDSINKFNQFVPDPKFNFNSIIDDLGSMETKYFLANYLNKAIFPESRLLSKDYSIFAIDKADKKQPSMFFRTKIAGQTIVNPYVEYNVSTFEDLERAMSPQDKLNEDEFFYEIESKLFQFPNKTFVVDTIPIGFYGMYKRLMDPAKGYISMQPYTKDWDPATISGKVDYAYNRNIDVYKYMFRTSTNNDNVLKSSNFTFKDITKTMMQISVKDSAKIKDQLVVSVANVKNGKVMYEPIESIKEGFSVLELSHGIDAILKLLEQNQSIDLSQIRLDNDSNFQGAKYNNIKQLVNKLVNNIGTVVKQNPDLTRYVVVSNDVKQTNKNLLNLIIVILFDLKKAGDWGLVQYCKEKQCPLLTVDKLCALYAILNDVSVVFSGTLSLNPKDDMTYVGIYAKTESILSNLNTNIAEQINLFKKFITELYQSYTKPYEEELSELKMKLAQPVVKNKKVIQKQVSILEETIEQSKKMHINVSFSDITKPNDYTFNDFVMLIKTIIYNYRALYENNIKNGNITNDRYCNYISILDLLLDLNALKEIPVNSDLYKITTGDKSIVDMYKKLETSDPAKYSQLVEPVYDLFTVIHLFQSIVKVQEVLFVFEPNRLYNLFFTKIWNNIYNPSKYESITDYKLISSKIDQINSFFGLEASAQSSRKKRVLASNPYDIPSKELNDNTINTNISGIKENIENQARSRREVKMGINKIPVLINDLIKYHKLSSILNTLPYIIEYVNNNIFSVYFYNQDDMSNLNFIKSAFQSCILSKVGFSTNSIRDMKCMKMELVRLESIFETFIEQSIEADIEDVEPSDIIIGRITNGLMSGNLNNFLTYLLNNFSDMFNDKNKNSSLLQRFDSLTDEYSEVNEEFQLETAFIKKYFIKYGILYNKVTDRLKELYPRNGPKYEEILGQVFGTEEDIQKYKSIFRGLVKWPSTKAELFNFIATLVIILKKEGPTKRIYNFFSINKTSNRVSSLLSSIQNNFSNLRSTLTEIYNLCEQNEGAREICKRNRVCSTEEDIKENEITRITKDISVEDLEKIEKQIQEQPLEEDIEMQEEKADEEPGIMDAIKEDDNNPLLYNVGNQDLDEKEKQKIKEGTDELRYETFIQYMQDPENACKNFGKRNCILAKEMNVCKYNSSRRACYKNSNVGNTIMNLRKEFQSKPIDYDIQFKTFNEDTIVDVPDMDEKAKKRIKK
jgi:hypothetical protein